MRKRVIIMGAAGRDFHNFNVYFRENQLYEVVAFTATQIPNIEGRRYPKALAGKLYQEGIPIYKEDQLPGLIDELGVEQVIFAYSDISHEDLMHKASGVLAKGADFRMMGGNQTMLKAQVPVIAICAVRTGSGKSQTTRKATKILKKNKRVVVVRHPMPYGDLEKQAVQRYAKMEDLDSHECTIEEREEYEPHIENGIIVYAGVDYEKILRQAEKEADIIVWDGGNNDTPFYRPDLHITMVDPHRPRHGMTYHPGETNLRLADVIIMNKMQTANREEILAARETISIVNPRAILIEATSPIKVEKSEMIRGKRVLVIEDGPSVTHGGLSFGAGLIAAEDNGAREIVDPRKFAVGSIRQAFSDYPHMKKVLPAMGYDREQIRELEETINASDCDIVVSGTPIDLNRVLKANKPIIRIRYELEEIGHPDLEEVLLRFIK
ncbi:MAG TPA: GTPase [Euryarchaeota archaeon]|nr:GTPase [Euryarchaeota archaeon]